MLIPVTLPVAVAEHAYQRLLDLVADIDFSASASPLSTVWQPAICCTVVLGVKGHLFTSPAWEWS